MVGGTKAQRAERLPLAKALEGGGLTGGAPGSFRFRLWARAVIFVGKTFFETETRRLCWPIGDMAFLGTQEMKFARRLPRARLHARILGMTRWV